MIKTAIYLTILAFIPAGLQLNAEPTPSSPKKKSSNASSKKTDAAASTTSTVSGWSMVNGVWMHSDGYKFVNNQVVRSSPQTHKPVPKPPTQADIQAAARKKPAAKTPAEMAAEKAAQKERNMAPRPASQTGSHL
jgi:hypothetical protein